MKDDCRTLQCESIRRGSCSLDRLMKSVSFHWHETCGYNQLFQVFSGEPDRSLSACLMGDLFRDNGSFQVVRAEVQRGLSQLQPEHDPVGFNVRDVAQDEPRRGNGFQGLHSARSWQI